MLRAAATMETCNSSPLVSKKSKKPMRSPSSSSAARKGSFASASEADLLSVKTPGKTADPPRPVARRRAALSIKDVKQEALRLQDKASFSPPAKTRLEFGSLGERVTPVKKKKKRDDSGAPLPEKYELLNRFFNSLDSSIRLLQLKRYPTTFTNISSQIEKLTDRRFTCSHLAQLMFLMPKAIVVEKSLHLDERTSCMKPELRIRLNVEALDTKTNSVSDSRYLQLRKVFHGRLVEFVNSHPEGDDVPQEELPEPFCWSQERANEDPVQSVVAAASSLSPSSSDLTVNPARASHLSSSFKRCFSLRGSMVSSEGYEFPGKSPAKLCAEPSIKENNSPSKDETPLKNLRTINYENDDGSLGTPVELTSVSTKFMSATPALGPRKRIISNPDGDDSFRSPTKLIRRPAKRPLRFDTPVKSEEVEDKCGPSSSSYAGILDILPESLVQSIREKERLALIAQDPDISRAKQRRQMISRLPKLFDSIHFLFQSIRRSLITKQELIHKIVSTPEDTLCRNDVEEQLRLLQELASDWIYEKTSSNGDLLVCINKISNPESIRRRLHEAK